MAELGITVGCGLNQVTHEAEYCVEEPVTWGQLAVFTMRAWQIKESGYAHPIAFDYRFVDNQGNPTSPWADVPTTHGFYPYIVALYKKGFVTVGCNGTGSADFCVDTTVTRGATTNFIVQGAMEVADPKPIDQSGTIVVGQSAREYVRMGSQIIASEDLPSVGGIGPAFNVIPTSVQLFTANQMRFTASSPATWDVVGSGLRSTTSCPKVSYGTVTSEGVYTAPDCLGQRVDADHVPNISVKATSGDKVSFATVLVATPGASRINLSPTTSTILSNQSRQFVAQVVDSSGNSLTGQSLSWSLYPDLSGTISSTGLYTPPTDISSPITVQVIAKLSSGLTGNASITVTPVTLGNVSVQPIGLIGGKYATVYANVAASPNTNWTVAPPTDVFWVRVAGMTGKGVGVITFQVDPNSTGARRQATFNVNAANSVSVVITQDTQSSADVVGSPTSIPPTTISVSPIGGSSVAGSTLVMTGTYSAYGGGSNIQSAVIQISPESSLSQLRACVVRYNPATAQFSVSDDFGDYQADGVLANSQCTVSAAQSSATVSGNTLSVSYAIRFASGFVGAKSVYAYAADVWGGYTGWNLKGSWTVNPLVPVQVTVAPSAAYLYAGQTQAFQGTATAYISNPGVTWSRSGANLQGSISVGGNTATYTAPASIPFGASPPDQQLTATSVECATCSGSALIRLYPPASPALVSGTRSSGTDWVFEGGAPSGVSDLQRFVVTFNDPSGYPAMCSVALDKQFWGGYNISLNDGTSWDNFTQTKILGSQEGMSNGYCSLDTANSAVEQLDNYNLRLRLRIQFLVGVTLTGQAWLYTSSWQQSPTLTFGTFSLP